MDGYYGTQISQDLDGANFTAYMYRRQPNSNNQVMHNDGTDFWRMLLIRYPPNGESTAQSRQEGMEALRQFLMDDRFSDFPPSTIGLTDATDEENYTPLDDLFLDSGIKTLMEEDVPVHDLNSNFYASYPDFALKCWGGRFRSPYANILGFPPDAEH